MRNVDTTGKCGKDGKKDGTATGYINIRIVLQNSDRKGKTSCCSSGRTIGNVHHLRAAMESNDGECVISISNSKVSDPTIRLY